MSGARKSLDALKDSDAFNNRADRTNILYILDNFELTINTFHYSWSFTTQIRGGLTALLSSKWKLPNYLHVVFSNDQVSESEILGDEIYKVLQDLFTFINRKLLERKVVLPKKARHYKPTQVTIVKMVPKAMENLNNFKNKRRTFDNRFDPAHNVGEL